MDFTLLFATNLIEHRTVLGGVERIHETLRPRGASAVGPDVHSQCGDPGQPVGGDNGTAGSARLRCGQAVDGPQASHRGQHPEATAGGGSACH